VILIEAGKQRKAFEQSKQFKMGTKNEILPLVEEKFSHLTKYE
jgi:hypothetical protein